MARNNKSLTLIEVVLVIAVIGILAAVVLIRFGKGGFVERLTLRSATRQISADLRYTRQLAITHSGHYLIKFDFTQKEYRIYKDSIGSQNQIGETKKIPTEIQYSGTDQFDFYALGNCIFKGSGILFSLNSMQYQVMVEPPSGAVVVEKLS